MNLPMGTTLATAGGSRNPDACRLPPPRRKELMTAGAAWHSTRSGGLMRLKHITRLASIALSTLVAATAQAQSSFPNKPVHIIVGFAAGGGNDIIVRAVSYTHLRAHETP